ncbi:XdhC family protein [Blautia producta]|nr:XdhC family protein [Blautia producta]NSG14612.1 XdhC family protein [Blautia producta]NSJ74803.1 XdhC family protein [Blautia producta]
MKELFETARKSMEKKQDLVFVTTISSSGSSPRGAGSKMLVLENGTSYGTIGGGNVEYVSIQHAREVLKQKQSCTRGFALHPDQVADLGMICGGDVVIFFQYISWENQDFYDLCTRILKSWDKNENTWLIFDITEETVWKAGLYEEQEGLTGLGISDPSPLLQTKAVQKVLDGRKYYCEPLVQKGRVYIFGGGHVAQALVPVLARLEFRCVVFDDREAFSNPQVFPEAEQCILGDFNRISDYLSIQPQDYVCIMSRGHQYDYLIQKQILTTPAYYIGVMGSRKKKEVIRQKLLADGFFPEDISRITTPIGLDILAETPEEIAVSIAGQLIAERAKSATR